MKPWHFQNTSVCSYEYPNDSMCITYFCRNLTRPMLVKNLAKGIVDLCTSQESGDETLDLRKQIVNSLVVSLLDIESTADADADDTADSVSKGLRKVSRDIIVGAVSASETELMCWLSYLQSFLGRNLFAQGKMKIWQRIFWKRPDFMEISF